MIINEQEVTCPEDEGLERSAQAALSKLYAALAPVRPPPVPADEPGLEPAPAPVPPPAPVPAPETA